MRMLEFIGHVGASNLRFALNVGHAVMTREEIGAILTVAGDRLGMVLLCAPRRDMFGQFYDAHAPLYAGGVDILPLAGWAHVLRVLDGDYQSPDEEYLDWMLVQ